MPIVQRTTLPYTDETVVSYIVGLLEDEEEDEKEILEMTKGMLEGGPDGDDKLADLEALSVQHGIAYISREHRLHLTVRLTSYTLVRCRLMQDRSSVRVSGGVRDSTEAQGDRQLQGARPGD